jgi:orotidine-5'-phosphate decarboxylase
MITRGPCPCTTARSFTSPASIVVNSSRSVLYASADDGFAAAARRVALDTRNTLEAARQGQMALR